MAPALDVPLHNQALSYYSRYYVEVPHGLPEIVDGHLKYATADRCYSQPQSMLSLAIFAVSHATGPKKSCCLSCRLYELLECPGQDQFGIETSEGINA